MAWRVSASNDDFLNPRASFLSSELGLVMGFCSELILNGRVDERWELSGFIVEGGGGVVRVR